MYDVVVYSSSLPRIADRSRKMETLMAFAEGAQTQGARVLVQNQLQVVPAKLAVILGWVGSKIRGPHIQLRRDVIDHQLRNGCHVMPIDSSCFKFADTDSKYLRYSLDGVFYNTNNYANSNSTDQQWQKIKQDLNINLMPWRNNGDHVLLCLQRDGGWSLKGVDLHDWTLQTLRHIRQHTNRPILVRPHPKFPVNQSEMLTVPGVTVSRNTTLDQDLAGAWASVFYNSSSSVASILAGVPVFATDSDCVAWSLANRDFDNLENPGMPAREQWLFDLSCAHWSDEDSKAGKIYKTFMPYLQ
jgi:hypothetical protein